MVEMSTPTRVPAAPRAGARASARRGAGRAPPRAARRGAAPPPARARASAAVTPVPTPTGPTPEPSFVRPTPTSLPTFLSYVVKAGDTLSSIARTFATNVDSVAFWNRDAYPSLDPESEGYAPNRIEVGWTFVLMPGVKVDLSEVPDRTPTPAPSATAGETTAPSPTGGGASTKVREGWRASGMVALTFDLGGRLDPAIDIMDWLIEAGVHATIFPTGKTGSTTTVGRAVLERVGAHPDLFDLGNHSWSHPDFRDLTAAEVRDEIARTETALEAIAGTSPRPWFRPPFGGVDATVLARVGAAGYHTTVMWDVDTIDWRPEADGGPTAEDIVRKVVTTADGGSIVLMHLGGFHTFEALPELVAGLEARGLTPVTLSELLGG